MRDDGKDSHFIKRAAQLAHAHMESGAGGPFGAVIVRDGQVIAEGWNEVTSSLDPTAHAEVVAIRRACEAVGDYKLEGATLYSSCEPCPMCLAAIYWARIDRLVFASTRDEAAAVGFDDALIYAEVPKAPHERLLPTRHMRCAEADTVFAAWDVKQDKIPY